MKLMKLLLAAPVLIFLAVLFSGTTLNSCNKTTTVHDTVTTIKVDTLVNLDTVYCLKCGLVAYYNFNNGTLNDSSGNGNNITFNNATPTSDRFGNSNNAYLFNGTSNYMSVPNSPSLNPNSITLFVIFKPNGYFSGPCHGNQLIQKGTVDNEDGWYGMRFNDTLNNCSSPVDTAHEILFGAYGDEVIWDAYAGTYLPTSLRTGTWYVAALTYDGTTSKIYINGVLKNTTVKSDSFTPNTDDLFIGYDPDRGGEYWFNGVIDEIRIYNQALCPGAIAQLSKQAN
jgi:Concanavalin A-like lectin/glucanases superfamily